jgi:hypothetical protein
MRPVRQQDLSRDGRAVAPQSAAECRVDTQAESFGSVPQGGRRLFDRQDGRLDIRPGRIGSQ